MEKKSLKDRLLSHGHMTSADGDPYSAWHLQLISHPRTPILELTEEWSVSGPIVLFNRPQLC